MYGLTIGGERRGVHQEPNQQGKEAENIQEGTITRNDFNTPISEENHEEEKR